MLGFSLEVGVVAGAGLVVVGDGVVVGAGAVAVVVTVGPATLSVALLEAV
jgi:hypothetical protein